MSLLYRDLHGCSFAHPCSLGNVESGYLLTSSKTWQRPTSGLKGTLYCTPRTATVSDIFGPYGLGVKRELESGSDSLTCRRLELSRILLNTSKPNEVFCGDACTKSG